MGVIRNCDYLDYAVSESMRKYPNGFGTVRDVAEDIQIGPYFIPKGVGLWGNTWSLRHSTKIWGTEFDPKEYLPERWAELDTDTVNRSSFFPFGVGQRDCAGQRVARLVMRIVAVLVMSKYVLKPVVGRDIKIINDAGIQIEGGYWFTLEKR